ncbi:MAG: DUF996 domain-containing protein [Nitrososphaerota archaeon]|nr:DUF996 domain-containing protein [Nitrososphaerota archaeon]
MASLSEAKSLGGVGSVLVLLTVAPTVGWILGIAGFVMTLVAVKYISQIVKEVKIFNDMLISVVLAIGGIAVGTVTVLGAVFRALGMGSFVGTEFVPGPNIAAGDWIGLALGVLAGLAVVWALMIASAVFLRRSYDSIAAKLNVGMFRTTGLLYLIGAATTIIGVGFALILVAQILAAVSFFSMPERPPEPAQTRTIPASV